MESSIGRSVVAPGLLMPSSSGTTSLEDEPRRRRLGPPASSKVSLAATTIVALRRLDASVRTRHSAVQARRVGVAHCDASAVKLDASARRSALPGARKEEISCCSLTAIERSSRLFVTATRPLPHHTSQGEGALPCRATADG